MARRKISGSDTLVTEVTYALSLIPEAPGIAGYGALVVGQGFIEPAGIAAVENVREALRTISGDQIESQRTDGRQPCRFFVLSPTMGEATALAARIQRERTAATPSYRPRSWAKPTLLEAQQSDPAFRNR